jgi:ribosomal protein L37AE/L43A
VNNKFLISLQKGEIENFGSHFQEGPYGDGSIGDERRRWKEFKEFRDQFSCPNCARTRFKRPFDLKKPVCAAEACETPFDFTRQSTEAVAPRSEPVQVASEQHVN